MASSSSSVSSIINPISVVDKLNNVNDKVDVVDDGCQTQQSSKMSTSSSSSFGTGSGANISVNMTISTTSTSLALTIPVPIDKLRIIRPFEEKQLLQFYFNELLEKNEKIITNFIERYVYKDSNDYYDSIVRLEKALEKFTSTNRSVKQLIESIIELQKKCWIKHNRQLNQTGSCGDGMQVQAVHTYTECIFDNESASELEHRYYHVLKERIMNEHMVTQYQHRRYQLRFELIQWQMLELIKRCKKWLASCGNDCKELTNDQWFESSFETMDDSLQPQYKFAKEQLQDWIAALFVYYRKTDLQTVADVRSQCIDSLMTICSKYLSISTAEDRLFLLNQILRCPTGSSVQLARLIICPNPMPFRKSNYALGKQLVDFAVTVILTILSPIVDREKFINSDYNKTNSSSNTQHNTSPKSNEPWLLVDSDFEDDLVTLTNHEITEFDLINYLHQIPFEKILEFMSIIDEDQVDINQSDGSTKEEHLAQSAETNMIKLFAFNTRLIQILRNGLQSFNCLRYKELTLHIASMIKAIISKISDSWVWCKTKFTTKDQALLVRLQVEFDTFMLRSIMTILSTNRRGVWPLLACIEFVGVSEPMMWHILWVVYNNGSDNSSELSGLCPYMSSNYWKDKFANYRQWKFVFVERISQFSVEEATGLINFFYNMASSRDVRVDTDFLHEIIYRVAEICLLKKCILFRDSDKSTTTPPATNSSFEITNQQFYLLKGNLCLVNLANQFTPLTTTLLQFISEQDENNLLEDSCFQLFESLLIENFIPDEKFFQITYDWLETKPFDHLFNRLARIAFSKLGWNKILLHSNRCLLLSEKTQHRHAIKLYQSVVNQLNMLGIGNDTNKMNPSMKQTLVAAIKSVKSATITRTQIGYRNSLQLARSANFSDYIAWCWNSLLFIRIHPLDFIPDECAWDDIVFGPADEVGSRALQNIKSVRTSHRIFHHMPRLNSDTELASISNCLLALDPKRNKELKSSNKRNLAQQQDLSTTMGSFAAYIALSMTDFMLNNVTKYIDLMYANLTAKPPNIPCSHHFVLLDLLYHMLPLKLHHVDQLKSNPKFIAIILDLIQNDFTSELCSIIICQVKHFHHNANALQLSIAWTEILFETMHAAVVTATKTSSWFSAINPVNLMSSSSSSSSLSISSIDATQLEELLERFAIIFDRLAHQIVTTDNENSGSNELFENYVAYLAEKPYTKLISGTISQGASTSGPVSNSSLMAKLASMLESPPVGSVGSIQAASNSNDSGSLWTLFNLMSWSSNDDAEVYYLPDRALIRSEWLTPFHLLVRQFINRRVTHQLQSRTITNKLVNKFKFTSTDMASNTDIAPFYLAYVLIESDIRRSARVWDHFVYQIYQVEMKETESAFKNDSTGTTLSANFETLLKQVCQQLDTTLIPFAMLPINTLIVLLLNSVPPPPLQSTSVEDVARTHPIIPLLWKNFFQLYFSHSSNCSSSVGMKFLNKQLHDRLDHRLSLWFDHHNRRWLALNNQNVSTTSSNNSQSDHILALLFEDRLLKLYRAYRLWLQDARLHSAYVNLDDDPDYVVPEFQANILKCIFSAGDAVLQSGRTTAGNKSLLFVRDDHHYATNFFFLNYVNRVQLQEELEQIKDFWFVVTKLEGSSCSSSSTISIPQVTQVQEKFSNEKNVSTTKSISTTNKLVDSSIIRSSISTGQYQHLIQYFTALTTNSSIKANLLFDDNVAHLLEDHDSNVDATSSATGDQLLIQDPSVVMVIIHQLIDTIMEEARFVENQLEKFSSLNKEFCADTLPRLYQNVHKCTTKRISCEREEFDANGCNNAATIVFDYVESVEDPYTKQRYDRNRTELDAVLTVLTTEVPVSKVIGSVYFLNKVFHYLLRFFDGDPHGEQNQQRIKQLLKSMFGWIELLNSVQSANYFVTGQILDQLLEILQQLSPRYIDEVNYFLLNTALQRNMHSSVIQQLAPCLTPSKGHNPGMFVEMYNLIGTNSMHTSQQTTFVLLSKFDVGTWLQSSCVTDEQRMALLDSLYKCLCLFGLNPSDEYLITFDLYRKHLQDFIMCRFPLFMPKILQFMLDAMDECKIAPALWNSVLHTFGFYTKSLSFGRIPNGVAMSGLINFDYVTFDYDLREYVHRQKILSSHDLYELIQTISLFHYGLNQTLQVEFLDHLKSYSSKYLQFISFMSYCWIQANCATVSSIPDDVYSVVWIPFFDLWKHWIFPRKTTKFITTDHLSFSWQLFIDAFQFACDSFPTRCTVFLSHLWQYFSYFIKKSAKDAIEVSVKDVQLFEQKLLQIKYWPSFDPELDDIELMYDTVIQNHFSLERLIAYIISRINWPRALSNPSRRLNLDQLSNLVDNLSYVLIALSEQSYISEIDLGSIPFAILSPSKVKQTTLMLLPIMKQKMSSLKNKTTVSSSSSASNKNKDSKSSDMEKFLNTFFYSNISSNDDHPKEGILLALLRTICDVDPNRRSSLTASPDTSLSLNNISPSKALTEMYRLPADSLSDTWFITKNLYYTNCFASLIAFYCNLYTKELSVAENGKKMPNNNELHKFLQIWSENMHQTLLILEPMNRLALFDAILSAINQVTADEVTRKRLATNFVTIFSYTFTSHILIADLILSVNRIIHSVRLVCYLLESFIENFLDLGGDLEFLINNLNLNLVCNARGSNRSSSPPLKSPSSSSPGSVDNSGLQPTSSTIEESVQSQCCLLILVHIYNRLCKSTVPESCTKKYICKLISQCANFKPSATLDECKILLFFYKLISLLTSPMIGSGADALLCQLSASMHYFTVTSITINQANIGPSDLLTQEALHQSVVSLHQLCRSIHESINESLSRGWLFFRTIQRHSSNWCLFLLETMVLHGVCTIMELYFPDAVLSDYLVLLQSPHTSNAIQNTYLLEQFKLIGSSSVSEESTSSSVATSSNDRKVGQYSDTIRHELKAELQELLKSSLARLTKSWKRDKSYTEVWPYIDHLIALHQQQLDTVCKVLIEPQNMANQLHHANNTADYDHVDVESGDLNNLSLYRQQLDRQLNAVRAQLQLLQRKRFELIRSWIGTLYSDKNYVKQFLS